MPLVEINGHPTYFEDGGGSAAAIVLSHGFLMDHEMFAPQVGGLRDEFRVIIWDERVTVRRRPVDPSPIGIRGGRPRDP
jgi:pimeloyl-ACP methyl ester carboxylesterase